MGWIDRLRRPAFGDSRQKVPTILQMEGTECGAASLAMILAHYGQWVPLEKLRAECGVNRDGSKAGAILRAARARGCEARGMQSHAEYLTKLGFPLIIHWNFNHFLVLEGIKKGRAYLNDPAVGRRSVPWEEFRTSFTGIVMKITPGAGFKKEGAPYNVVKEVAGKLKEDKWSMLFISCIALGMIFPGLAQPVFQQIFLDEIMTAKHPDWMFNLLLGMVLTVVLLLTMTSLRAAVLTKWQKKLTLADSSKFFWHILRLPMQFFQQRYAAEVASRISFNESVASVLSDAAATSVLDLLVALFFLALLFQYSVTLTLIGIATSAISIGVFLLLRRKITDLNMRMQQETGKEYGTLMNGIMMIESIKASGAEADIFGKWAGYHAKVLSATQEVEFWSLSATALPVFLASLNAALILTIGGFSIMEGLMTTGIYMAFQNLMGNFQAPVNKLVGLGTSLQTTEMQMRRLDDVRRYEVDDLHFGPQAEVDAAQLKELHRLSGALVLKDITFGYSPLEKPLLSDFNLTLAPGRWVAVVGASGSGKSTVAKLVAGLYEQWSGEVLFDGQPRRSIPRALLVGSVGVVDQDIFLLSGTVRENISLFDSAVSLDDVTQAARDACIHEDIMQLDGGYESMVSEGGRNFSGGQRQRLEIARALAKKPAMLVLDEATSALDPVTEKEVLKNIRRRGCSCFIVAHRLSTIRDCDEIIVLSQGQVVERGTHREMIAHDGPYSRLVREKDKEE